MILMALGLLKGDTVSSNSFNHRERSLKAASPCLNTALSNIRSTTARILILEASEVLEPHASY